MKDITGKLIEAGDRVMFPRGDYLFEGKIIEVTDNNVKIEARFSNGRGLEDWFIYHRYPGSVIVVGD